MVGRLSDVERTALELAADPHMVILDGFHCVKHAVRFGAELVLLVTPDRGSVLDLAAGLAPDIRERLDADLTLVGPSLVARLRGVDPTSRLVGFASRPVVPTAAAAPVVLLDNPRQLGNVGAVVRVAAGFGAGGVVTTGSVDPWHPTVVRAAAGLHFAVPVRRASLDDPDLAGRRPLIGLDPAGVDLRTVAVPAGALLAFGSERHGLSETLRARADLVAAIPMRELVSSYNLATSVAVTLYHWSAAQAR